MNDYAGGNRALMHGGHDLVIRQYRKVVQRWIEKLGQQRRARQPSRDGNILVAQFLRAHPLAGHEQRSTAAAHRPP